MLDIKTSLLNLLVILLWVWCVTCASSNNGDHHHAVSPSKISKVGDGIEKRQAATYRTKRYDQAEKDLLLKLHNDGKAKQAGTNMLKMKWDNALMQEAYRWSSLCQFRHPRQGERQSVGGYPNLGQNLFWTSGEIFNVSEGYIGWYDEIKDYTYNPIAQGDCVVGKMCGHYTQAIWHNTRAVGCGFKWCTETGEIQGTTTSGYLVTCEYGPAGNYRGQYPYNRGKACSECPKDGKKYYCDNTLCSLEKPTNPPPNKGGSLHNGNVVVFAILALLFFLA